MNKELKGNYNEIGLGGDVYDVYDIGEITTKIGDETFVLNKLEVKILKPTFQEYKRVSKLK